MKEGCPNSSTRSETSLIKPDPVKPDPEPVKPEPARQQHLMLQALPETGMTDAKLGDSR